MISRVNTVSILGLEPTLITVEVDTTQGLPQLKIIGLPTKAIEEAKERIVSAFNHIGIEPRRRRTIINLTPAYIPKTSAGVELAIAVGLLHQYTIIDEPPKYTAYFGSLSLDGSILPVKGLLPLTLAAISLGITDIIFPNSQVALLSQIKDVHLRPITHLQDIVAAGKKKKLPIIFNTQTSKVCPEDYIRDIPICDFSEIAGQETAKRALTICAAGGHHVLLNGPPGAGKSLLAQAFAGILPPLTQKEKLEVTSLHSLVITNPTISLQRPFRQPHHTASYVGLVGGTNQLLPGEITLSHRGVLFLDELAEFPRTHIEALREPLSQGNITLKRAAGSVTYPAQFILVAATNPCPCGYAGSTIQTKRCNCNFTEKKRYEKKISGPIKDRIDLSVFVRPASFTKLQTITHTQKDKKTYQSQSKIIQNTVIKAREKQKARYHHTGVDSNANLTHQNVISILARNRKLNESVEYIHKKLHLSMRATFSLVRVAQTIADLENSSSITKDHLLEATQYRH